MDIILFNDTRSSDIHETNYSILEQIKDDGAVSCNCNCQIMHFKTPNIVIIFSNYVPDTEKLNKDRWRIYKIAEIIIPDKGHVYN